MVTTAGGPDFAVVALDAASGVESWRHVVDGSATGAADADDAFGVAVDAAGDVIAVGRISDAVSDDDLVVMKLAGATGAELWRTTVKGDNDNDDDAQAVALDAGDALVVGSIRNDGPGRDIFLGRFAGATGAEQWRLQVDGSEHAGDMGSAIAVGGAGGVVATGRLRNGPAADGFAILERTAANGGDFPCANGHRDPGEACDDGNLVIGDGCRADCTAEVCGDGIRDPQEECDDGNVLDGDCCSAVCTMEPDGNACDDGDACTAQEACAAAKCVPAVVVVCTPETSCQVAACDPATGTCARTSKPDGSLCDDGNACTLLERCVAAACMGGTPRGCDDEDACTVDRCDPAVGCTSDPRPGFESVTCVLERDDIRNACGPDVPRPIELTIDRVGRLLDQGANADRPRGVLRALARAITATNHGVKVIAKRLRQKRVTSACGAGITDTLNDIVSRATGLRQDLAARKPAAGR